MKGPRARRGVNSNMRISHRWITVFSILAAAILFTAARRSTKTMTAGTATSSTAKKSVIVELFTSEGCSSCPPADELLGRLRQEPNSIGWEVIPLGFHVDYWDSSGWHDRFDSAAFSKRQEDYARRFHLEGPYTPQMVVNGELEFVGSLAGQAHEAIAQTAAETPAANVNIRTGQGNSLLLQIISAQPGDVMLAISEDNLSTNVGGGENGGRILHHSAVVRDLRRVGEVANGQFSSRVLLALNQEWKRQNLRAVVFVQSPDSGKILGASSLSLSSLAGMN